MDALLCGGVVGALLLFALLAELVHLLPHVLYLFAVDGGCHVVAAALVRLLRLLFTFGLAVLLDVCIGLFLGLVEHGRCLVAVHGTRHERCALGLVQQFECARS